MNLETLVIQYDNLIEDNAPYKIDRKKNIIYINPVYNDCISVSYSLFEYLGCKHFDDFYTKYKREINDFIVKLESK
jgi:hypothetical protein